MTETTTAAKLAANLNFDSFAPLSRGKSAVMTGAGSSTPMSDQVPELR